MKLGWITSMAEFARVAPAWDEALEGSGCDNPFLLSPFLLPWMEMFVPARGLRVLTLHEHGQLLGGWPLYLARRHGFAMLRHVGIGFANWTEPFAFDPMEFAEASMAGLARLPGWRYANFPLLRPQWAEVLTAAPGPGLLRHRSRAGVDGAVVLREPVEEYLQSRSPKLRANLRRGLRRAEEQGGVELRQVQGAAAVAALAEFQLLWNGPNQHPPDRVIPASRDANAEYTRRVLSRCAAARRLDAFELCIGKRRAAAALGLRAGGNYNSFLIAHDPAFAVCGPGVLLWYYLLDWLWRHRGAGEVRLEMFGDAAEPDKRRWCNRFEPLHAVRCLRLGVGGLRWNEPVMAAHPAPGH